MIKKLLELEDLTLEESYQLFAQFSAYSVEKQAAVLSILRAKKESLGEISGALKYFRARMEKLDHGFDVVDIVGTGGDGLGAFNISTAASIVMASCGVLVAKHGGKSASSESGSYDLVQELGIKVARNPEEALSFLERDHYSYLWAPLFNKELGKYGALRKNLSLPSMFNLLGPLLNPMRPKKCLIGVYRLDLLKKVADLLKDSDVDHALVVHSKDGLDELSVSSENYVIEIRNGESRSYTLSPECLGIKRAHLREMIGGNAKENAKIIKHIFSSEIKGAKLSVVCLNAAAGIYLSGKSSSILEGIELARDAITKGKALHFLRKITKEKE